MAKTYNILIVGAGTSGMACAITAAERGLRVGVIEKSDIIGGALHWSGGHMSAGGTRLQKRKGIEDSEEKHLEDIYRINGKSGNLALTEIAVKEAPKTIDWLEDIGFEFAPECPRIIYGHIAYETARTHYGTEKAMSIYKVLEPLWKKYERSGHIEFHLKTKMSGLGRTGNRFDYVLCQNERGTQEIHGKHIVLTTGGYGSNPEFFGKKHPGIPLVSSCYPTATADAHQILEENGGVFHMGQYHLPSLGGIEKEVGEIEKKKRLTGDTRLLNALYYESMKNSELYDSYIKRKAENWELERIARLDRILMHMAISEMLKFEEIPVKDSIYESLEVAKP